jgi:hypothetical protein
MTFNLILVAQLVLAAGILWASFCRLVHTDDGTAREIRWAFWFQFVASGFVLGAPLMPWLMPEYASWRIGSTPRWVFVAFVGSVFVTEAATSRFWLSGEAQARFSRHGLFHKPRGRYPAVFAAALLAAALIVLNTPGVAVAQLPPAPQNPDGSLPWVHMAQGQRAACADSRGCVVMSGPIFMQLQGALQGCADLVRGRSL